MGPNRINNRSVHAVQRHDVPTRVDTPQTLYIEPEPQSAAPERVGLAAASRDAAPVVRAGADIALDTGLLPRDGLSPGERVVINGTEFKLGGRRAFALGAMEGTGPRNRRKRVIHVVIEGPDGSFGRTARVELPVGNTLWYHNFETLLALPSDNGARLFISDGSTSYGVAVASSGAAGDTQALDVIAGPGIFAHFGKDAERRLALFNKDGFVRVYGVSSSGALHLQSKLPSRQTGPMVFECLKAVDLFGRGEKGLLLANGLFYREGENGEWSTRDLGFEPSFNASIAVGDVDGDGKHELVLVDATHYIDFPGDLVVYDLENERARLRHRLSAEHNHPQGVQLVSFGTSDSATVIVPPQEGRCGATLFDHEAGHFVQQTLEVHGETGSFYAHPTTDGSGFLTFTDRGAVIVTERPDT
ncbi:MAG: hypothetical protein AAF654_03455 [Myxococcota bacterium]